MTVSTRVIERPERALALLCAAQIAFWTLAPALSHDTPPLDVVEMYAWGREGVVATFKHPNGPGLILEATRRLINVAGWPAYLMSQLCIVATFAAVFALGRELMDAKRALAGVLLLTGIVFFSWPTPEFNHNVLQMPFWALIVLLLWRATTRGGLLNWLLLGLLAGFSLWAKYSSAVLLVPAAAWILWDAQARRSLLTPGPYVALAAFIAAAAPQAIWLMQHDYQPLHYAARRSGGGGPLKALEFLATMAVDHVPFVLLLLFAGFFGKRAEGAPPKPEQRAIRFLLLLGLGPLALMVLGGVFGAGMRASWGAPIFNLSGLIAIALLSPRMNDRRLSWLGAFAGVLIVLVSGLYFAHMRYGAQFSGKELRGNWPEASITRALEAAWRSETEGAPLRIVAGDIWTAGLVGMSDDVPPSVLINGDFAISPWVTPEDVARDGVLIVWRDTDAAPQLALLGLTQRDRLQVRFPRFRNVEPLVLNYIVIAPGEARLPEPSGHDG